MSHTYESLIYFRMNRILNRSVRSISFSRVYLSEAAPRVPSYYDRYINHAPPGMTHTLWLTNQTEIFLFRSSIGNRIKRIMWKYKRSHFTKETKFRYCLCEYRGVQFYSGAPTCHTLSHPLEIRDPIWVKKLGTPYDMTPGWTKIIFRLVENNIE